MFTWKHKSVLLPTARYLVMIRNGPQNSKRVLWVLFSFACATAAGQQIHGAKSASTSPSTSKYPWHPILSIHQANGRVANVIAISNSIHRPDTKSPVKRQLDLHVSLKKCFCNVSFPLYNNHFLIRAFSTITKKQVIQRKNRLRPSPRLQPAQNFMQPPRLQYQLNRRLQPPRQQYQRLMKLKIS